MEGSDTGETVTRIGDPDPYRVEWLEKARGVNRSQRRRKKRSEEVLREETKRLLVTTSTWETLHSQAPACSTPSLGEWLWASPGDLELRVWGSCERRRLRTL